MSAFSGQIDERDISLKPQKKQREKASPKAAPAPAQPSAPEQAQMPSDAPYAQDAYAAAPQIDTEIPVQQYSAPAQPQYNAPAQPQYNAPAQPQYSRPVQQYAQPDAPQYAPSYQDAAPYQGTLYGQIKQPGDLYAGDGPSPYDAPVTSGPVDPMAFLNDEGNEGGNQNG